MATKPVPKKPEEIAPVVEPPTEKPATTDELGDTLDQFFATFQSSGLRTMKTILTQFKDKADAVITQLDGDVDGDAPKKQG